MTPFSSVAMLEKLALLRIAFCRAPVLSRAAARRISVTTSTVPAAPSTRTGSWHWVDIDQPPSPNPREALGDFFLSARGAPTHSQPHSMLGSLRVLKPHLLFTWPGRPHLVI